MKLLVVIPYCQKDSELVKILLDQIKEKDRDCLLVRACQVKEKEAEKVLKKAQGAFQKVREIQTPFELVNEDWPIGPNWMFETALRDLIKHQETSGWLWLEPDCALIRKTWLNELETTYERFEKPFMGEGRGKLSHGVAIYPGEKDRLNRLLRIVVQSKAKAHWTNALHEIDLHNTGLIFRGNQEEIPKTASLFHGCKDGSLGKVFKKPKLESKKCFYHSGDIGDVVYSLSLVKAMGGGTFVLGPDNKCHAKQRGEMNEPVIKFLKPLLEYQDYISEVRVSPVCEDSWVCLNGVRELYHTDRRKTWDNWVKTYFDWKGLKEKDWKWLDCPVIEQEKPKVICSRSSRYRTDSFPWADIVYGLKGHLLFAGTDQEYNDFLACFGYVDRLPMENLLNAATSIERSVLFIGNQSCFRAVAEGLKKPVLMEGFLGSPDCHFKRKDFKGFYDQDDIKETEEFLQKWFPDFKLLRKSSRIVC